MRSRDVINTRAIGKRQIAPENFLIMCEGKETEPNYFNGLKQLINSKYGDKVDVLIPSISVKGTGKNTTDLVNYTERFVNQAGKKYGKVWIVFDKDDYKDIQFNQAIKRATAVNYNAAWSNPCFELWLLLHLKSVLLSIPQYSSSISTSSLTEFNNSKNSLFVYFLAIIIKYFPFTINIPFLEKS